jgi:tripartite ATP-independent transporter DctM subunit
MSPEVIGIIGIVFLLILMFCNIKLGVCFIIVGFLGYALISGWDKALLMVGLEPFAQMNYTFTVVPLFLLMGAIVAASGINSDMYLAVRKWIGHIRGGLAMATCVASGIFAALCGTSLAGAVAMGNVAYPAMKKYNYDDRLAGPVIAAGGTLGILIPPSVPFILYGLITEQSIGKLFIAGIIPGILEIVFYIVAIYVICKIRPDYGPPGPRVSFKEKVVGLKYIWPMLLLILFILGGIYAGIFTPTEAGAMGAFGAIIICFAIRRLNKSQFKDALVDTIKSSTMIIFMLIGAFIFMRFVTVSRIPNMLSEFIVGIQAPPYLIILGIIAVYILLGCFMDALVIVLLTVPIIFPTILALGYNPIWWGVVMVRVIEIGMITPPFGMNLFVLSKTINVSVGTLYRGIVPFAIADVVHITLLALIPQISLFLVELI